jgi:hypothetical protein
MDPLFAMTHDPFDEDQKKDYGFGKKHYINNFLNNNLGFLPKNQIEFGFEKNSGFRVDPKTEYRTNSFGFRDDHWEGPAEIVALGCSNTYGVGVPVKGSWPKILQDMVNKEVRNLSQPGISINELVYQLFAYCKKFGNPKFIFCLFPDPFRIKLPTNENLINALSTSFPQGFGNINLNLQNDAKISNRPKYLKKPYLYDDIVPMELPLYFSMKSIHMLEQYCKSNKINLVWSSWHKDFQETMIEVKDNPFNYFYQNESFNTYYKINSNCHKDYDETLNEYFDSGLDIEDSLSIPHPGVHRHIHIAEAFYEKYGELQ